MPKDATVWRFLSLPKFIALLQSRGLYFTRADRLGDPLEGSSTHGEVAGRSRQLELRGLPQWSIDLYNADRQRVGPSDLAQFYVNCWHRGAHESMAMWRGYGEGAFGVALRSTFGRLDRHLPENSDAGPIELRQVTYFDFTSAPPPPSPAYPDAFAPILRKSVAYNHEAEIPAVILDLAAVASPETAPPGHLIPIDLTQVIESVVVSPLAPPWFETQIHNLCAVYGSEVRVVRSGEPRELVY